MVLVAVVFGDVAAREITGTGLHWARQAGVASAVIFRLGGLRGPYLDVVRKHASAA